VCSHPVISGAQGCEEQYGFPGLVVELVDRVEETEVAEVVERIDVDEEDREAVELTVEVREGVVMVTMLKLELLGVVVEGALAV